ncbi:hypothetical protein BDP27DRAFT_1320234 [Rhodocollybia butyracea]|uniref:Uncharacterized protein n=1 Tax=Rhodocollybia butyracea TaxID=206335 RepID=A0A9P5Q0L6_9AGAR|nr:hypothetical protein BDP27DRAFT_1320234 [Rhodocollybia butyracea]
MSGKVCRQIVVSNNGKFTASIYTNNPDIREEHLLEPRIQAGDQNIVFDLTTAYWWKWSDKFQVEVINWGTPAGIPPKSTDPTWLTFNKDSENEAVYSVAGDPNAPTISFKELRPIAHPKPPAPAGECRQIVVSNNGKFTASIYTNNPDLREEHLLEPKIEAGGQNIVFDLTKGYWWKHSNKFQVEVINWDTPAGNPPKSTDPTWLTFNHDSEYEAVYTVAGDPSAPTISFKELRPITNPKPPGAPGECQQIVVSNNGNFTASIYTNNPDIREEHLLEPKIQAGGQNVVFDLTKAYWWKWSDKFQVEVINWDTPAGIPPKSTDRTWLTFNKDSGQEAVYTVTGEPNAPTISFKEIRRIAGPIGSE